MRIAIINLIRGGLSGGYNRYLAAILPRLAACPDISQILCAAPSYLKNESWIPSESKTIVTPCEPFRFMRRCPDSRLTVELDRFKPDVIFSPLERRIVYANVPVVTMLQNMEPLVCPYRGNPIGERIRNWFRVRQARLAVHESTRVIAVSSYVREFLENQWGVSDAKIGTVYHGSSMPRSTATYKKPRMIPDKWRGRFVFTAGSVRPARGLEDILLALRELTKTDVGGLVIAGFTSSQMLKYRAGLQTLIRSKGIDVPVIWAGELRREEMAWCYQNCLLFAMTSRIESFGLIAVEAMSHGCVCISADNPCLPEVFGDVADYYAPRDSHSLAHKIKAMCHLDLESRAAIAERTKKRASKFSWDLCADETVRELKLATRN